MQLRDVPEVLAVEPDDERRHEQDRGDRREPLHDLVLVVRDLGLAVVAHSGDEVARQPIGARLDAGCVRWRCDQDAIDRAGAAIAGGVRS